VHCAHEFYTITVFKPRGQTHMCYEILSGMEQSPRDVLNGIRSYIMIFKSSSIDPANDADGSSAVSSAIFNGFKDL
jgi:hypothetical protein